MKNNNRKLQYILIVGIILALISIPAYAQFKKLQMNYDEDLTIEQQRNEESFLEVVFSQLNAEDQEALLKEQDSNAEDPFVALLERKNNQ